MRSTRQGNLTTEMVTNSTSAAQASQGMVLSDGLRTARQTTGKSPAMRQ